MNKQKQQQAQQVQKIQHPIMPDLSDLYIYEQNTQQSISTDTVKNNVHADTPDFNVILGKIAQILKKTWSITTTNNNY